MRTLGIWRHGRIGRLIIAVMLFGGLVPLGGVVSAQENGDGHPGTPVTFTFTTIEITPAEHEWVDAEGIAHFRGEVTIETVSGDIEGTATTTLDGDFVITGECNEEFCEGVFYGSLEVEIESEAGGWAGIVGIASSETGYDVFRGVLVGSGANAGSVILIDEFVEETEDSITVAGHLLSRGSRAGGVNIYYDGCFAGFTENGGTVNGGFIMNGPMEDSGSIQADFGLIGAPAPAVVYGDMTLTGEHGDLYVTFVESSYPGGGDHWFGHFIVVGGTGEYEGLYGFGKVLETAVFGQAGTCDGPKGHLIGEAFGG